MKTLIKKVNKLKEDEISNVINLRLKEFVNLQNNREKIFSELCFCLLTANFQAEKSIFLQKELEDDFFNASEEILAQKLKKHGHRFWPQRAERIVLCRNMFDGVYSLISEGKTETEIRNFVVKNVKGLGMKEASHFLRNIGLLNVAIIDFHIIDLLVDEGIIKRPKTITPKVYLEIEEVLRDLSIALDMSLGELDLYLWYLETGKVLK